MDAVQNIRTYNQKADISDQLEQAQSRFEQEETVDPASESSSNERI